MMKSPLLQPGMMNVKNAWGITNSFPFGTPGAFPVHTPDKIVIQDIEHWQDYVHAPSLKFTDEEWGIFEAQYNAVDTTKAYKAAFVAPGLFEQCHHLGEISNTLMNLYEYPDEMHDLIKYLTEWELELAEGICSAVEIMMTLIQLGRICLRIIRPGLAPIACAASTYSLFLMLRIWPRTRRAMPTQYSRPNTTNMDSILVPILASAVFCRLCPSS